MRRTPQTIGKILTSQDLGSGNLLTRAKALAQLDEEIKKCLDASLASHIQIGNINQNQLVIFADSQAWIVHLRYQQQHILDTLKKMPEFSFLQTITIRVQPGEVNTSTTTLPPPAQLSESNAKQLEDLSKNFGTSPLAKALQRLAQHTKK